jgi:hypothetical protein
MDAPRHVDDATPAPRSVRTLYLDMNSTDLTLDSSALPFATYR